MKAHYHSYFLVLLAALATPAIAQSTVVPAMAFARVHAAAAAGPGAPLPAADPSTDPTAAPVADPADAAGTPAVAPAALLAAAPSAPAPEPAAPAALPAPAPAETQLAGRVETAQGALAGASVRLLRFNQICVTNGAGDFFFSVPAGSGPLAAAVSYPGCADVDVTLLAGTPPAAVQMTTPVLSRAERQQLKPYLRTANHEIKRDLRHLR